MAFMVIQHYIPADEDSLGGYFTDVLFFAVGGFALLGMLSILTLTPFQVGKRWRNISDTFSAKMTSTAGRHLHYWVETGLTITASMI